jgi:hypothetical protein
MRIVQAVTIILDTGQQAVHATFLFRRRCVRISGVSISKFACSSGSLQLFCLKDVTWGDPLPTVKSRVRVVVDLQGRPFRALKARPSPHVRLSSRRSLLTLNGFPIPPRRD